jgi:hypothetical protein
MGYCTVADVVAVFPRFVRGVSGSISDEQIQNWIEMRAARIRSELLRRGLDPDALELTTTQENFLRGLNVDGAAADLGVALQGTVTLQPGEYSLASAMRASFERVIKEIQTGVHDPLFGVGATFAGVGGAETTPGQTAEDRGENRAFSKDEVF